MSQLRKYGCGTPGDTEVVRVPPTCQAVRKWCVLAFDSWLFSCDPKCKNGQIRNQMAGSDPTVEDCRLFTGLAVLQGHGSLAREDLEEER